MTGAEERCIAWKPIVKDGTVLGAEEVKAQEETEGREEETSAVGADAKIPDEITSIVANGYVAVTLIDLAVDRWRGEEWTGVSGRRVSKEDGGRTRAGGRTNEGRVVYAMPSLKVLESYGLRVRE